ncbi:MAG: hypothetical protein KAJ95_06265 [Gammaproteobacteria bacterium]|nr:hypothetical protein [Gammaproteobacteria bacterium]
MPKLAACHGLAVFGDSLKGIAITIAWFVFRPIWSVVLIDAGLAGIFGIKKFSGNIKAEDIQAVDPVSGS